MSKEIYDFILKNIHKIDLDLDRGLITTPRGTNGTVCSSTGYLRVKVSGKTLQVHQILAVKYFGEKCIGLQVNHKDGNKLNNSKENLEMVTMDKNLRHALETGLNKGSSLRGEEVKTSKLSEDEVRSIRKSNGISQRKLADKYGVSKGTIQSILERKSWKHVL